MAEQDYNLTVYAAGTKSPPYFTSVPVVDAYVGLPYSYTATAFEAGLSSLTSLSFTGPTIPTGMTVPTTGSTPGSTPVSWTPNYTQIGLNNVVLQVSDGSQTANQTFSIFVHPTPGNAPPVIVSTPVTTATPNVAYHYPVVAVDTDHDAQNFTLVTAPTGMTIDQTYRTDHLVPGLVDAGQSVHGDRQRHGRPWGQRPADLHGDGHRLQRDHRAEVQRHLFDRRPGASETRPRPTPGHPATPEIHRRRNQRQRDELPRLLPAEQHTRGVGHSAPRTTWSKSSTTARRSPSPASRASAANCSS